MKFVRTYGVQQIVSDQDAGAWEGVKPGWYWGVACSDEEEEACAWLEGDTYGPFETEEEAIKDMQKILDSIEILVEGAPDDGDFDSGEEAVDRASDS